MGTNYYIRYNICSCCNRSDEVHIGKSSMGWQFTFHSVDDYDIKMSSFDAKNMLAEDDSHLIIKNFQDWRKFIEKYVIEQGTAKIYNEYGEEESAQEFFSLVESKRDGKNHAEYINNDYTYMDHGDYVDEEGYSFSPGEFS